MSETASDEAKQSAADEPQLPLNPDITVPESGDEVHSECPVQPSAHEDGGKSTEESQESKLPAIDEKIEEESPRCPSDTDDPLPSGFGDVSKDCSEEDLRGWPQVLAKWRENLGQRPKTLPELVRRGIPEALRGEVWQLLANCLNHEELIAEYNNLLTRDCRDEMYVQRDISRTFPAHEFFKENGGQGQDSLYRVCKAYSLFDDEIGYCQGLSFVAAALLLHMPEEQAFCVLVKIMQVYGLRNMFKCGFEELHLRFYQLERFMEDHLPDLFAHFVENGIEAHMYASQWFLTLFTAKFPLYVVFYILDIYLLDGLPTMFQVALSLLSLSKSDLLALDFEGILKYFRVQLPKKYRSDESARVLLNAANQRKVRNNLKTYEKEYVQLKEQDKARGDALQRVQRENKRLVYGNMRLEQENDDLARELVSSKIDLRKQLDVSEDKADTLNKELLTANGQLVELEEERGRLNDEVTQLKEVLRREVERTEREIKRNEVIIADYKQITSHLSERLEKSEQSSKEKMERIVEKIKGCEECYSKVLEVRDGSTNGHCDQQNGDDSSSPEESLEQRVRELELELAQTKLALVEAECVNQDLTHDLNSAQSELEATSNTWLKKTIRAAKNAAANKRDALASSSSGANSKVSMMSRENSRDFPN